jgi:hypothetical protein
MVGPEGLADINQFNDLRWLTPFFALLILKAFFRNWLTCFASKLLASPNAKAIFASAFDQKKINDLIDQVIDLKPSI